MNNYYVYRFIPKGTLTEKDVEYEVRKAELETLTLTILKGECQKRNLKKKYSSFVLYLLIFFIGGNKVRRILHYDTSQKKEPSIHKMIAQQNERRILTKIVVLGTSIK